MSGVFIVGIEMPEIGTVNMEVVKHDDKYFIGPCGKTNGFNLSRFLTMGGWWTQMRCW